MHVCDSVKVLQCSKMSKSIKYYRIVMQNNNSHYMCVRIMEAWLDYCLHVIQVQIKLLNQKNELLHSQFSPTTFLILMY